MEEFLRNYVSRRLLALNKGEIAALTLAMRQLGVGSHGGAEALAIFHQPSTTFGIPLARIKVDDKKSFGTIECKAAREGARQLLPKHAGPADWKHRAFSNVEQEGLPPLTDRAASKWEGLLQKHAAIWRHSMQQASSPRLASLIPPTSPPFTQSTPPEHSSFHATGGEDNLGADDPRHKLQRNGGIGDLWYMDDGDIMVHPILVSLH